MKKLLLYTLAISALFSCREEDTTPPVVELNGEQNIQIDIFSQYTEEGATAFDETDGDITQRIRISNDIDLTRIGKYEVLYTATDNSGNTGVIKRNVNIVLVNNLDTLKNDTTAPVITIMGQNPLFININTAYAEPGVTAMDNTCGDITPLIEDTTNLDMTNEGSYFITYMVRDFSGNFSMKTRVVNVVDDHTPPEITIFGDNPLNIDLNSQYTEYGGFALDEVCGDVTNNMEIRGNVDTSKSGVYYVFYIVEDFLGNKKTKIRKVVVT